MKICIFSDIHGNGPAFNAAYKLIVAENADMNIFLGDLCGYYYDQLEILDKLITIPKLVAIKGNHDSVFLSIISGNNELRQTYKKRYGCSMEYLLNKDITKLVQWLAGLQGSYALSDMSLSCYHGSPWNFMEGYVYPDSRLDQFFDYPELCFLLGHTHYSMVRSIGEKLIINPGSLGQPRNGRWPTYAVFDYITKEVVLREVVYEKSEVIRRIDEVKDNNPYLKEILLR